MNTTPSATVTAITMPVQAPIQTLQEPSLPARVNRYTYYMWLTLGSMLATTGVAVLGVDIYYPPEDFVRTVTLVVFASLTIFGGCVINYQAVRIWRSYNHYLAFQ